MDVLYDFHSTVVNSTTLDNNKLVGDIHRGTQIVITMDDVDRNLEFLRDNFVEIPSDKELIQFFQTIHY